MKDMDQPRDPRPGDRDVPAPPETCAGASPATPDAPSLDESPLEALRDRIDAADARIIESLAERAEVVREVGRRKRESGYPIYAPHRERAVLEKVIELNAAAGGALPPTTIEAIYRELMSGSFRLEQPLRIASLGPPGSFSHEAAMRHFGASVEQVTLGSIDDVFAEVSAGRCDHGLVPYENSVMGGIVDTLDAFQVHEVAIYAESMLEVRHALLANVPETAVRRIYSKAQIFEQCRAWLRRNHPEVELVPVMSSARAVQIAAEEADDGAAAIGSTLAGRLHGVGVLHERIEDRANNVTRFLVLAKRDAEPSGDDRTTVMFVTAHTPGALVEVLGVLRDAGLNLSHIEKRPSGRQNWEYTFFADLEAHRADPGVAEAIEEATRHCLSLKVLGSYPKATRVL